MTPQMGILIGHVILVALALAACGVWWTSASVDRAGRTIVAVGLFLRAVPGVALFWISAHRLPIGSSYQLQPGFWFFGVDAEYYYRIAAGAAARGPVAIVALAPVLPSVFYIKSFAAALYLFGPSLTTSLLFNLLAYAGLAGCAIHWHERSGLAKPALLVTLSAVSLAPSWILWTYQPLKDTYFLLLVGLYFYGADRWYRRLIADTWSWVAALGVLGALAVVIYGIAGIRWYFAFTLVSMMPLAVLTALARRPRRSWWRAIAATLSVGLLLEVTVAGAGPYAPLWLRTVARPSSVQALLAIRHVPADAIRSVRKSHAQGVRAAGGTRIQLMQDEGSGLTPDGVSADASALDLMRGNLAAMLLPRWLATRVGRVTIGGGRGLWAFADLDTVFFVLTILASGWVVRRQLGRGDRLGPAFWQILAVTAIITLLLAYQAANFGTLFRLRSMIAIGIALLPLTLVRRTRPTASPDWSGPTG